MHYRGNPIWTLVLVVVALGCQPPPIEDRELPPVAPDESATDLDTGAVAPSQPGGADAAVESRPDSRRPSRPSASEPSKAAPQGNEREKVRAGVGKKGRGYGGGVISEPARVYFRVRERVVFQIQIPQALRVFKAQDPRGKGPKDEQEFMEKVIKQNGIHLPELPAGYKYVYDPQQEELMIEHPQP